MAEPVDFEGMALATSAVTSTLLTMLMRRGRLSRDDVARIMDECLLMVEEAAAHSPAARAAHAHLTLLQASLLGPDGPARPHR